MADLASHQHGVFDRVQATTAGLTTDAIRHRLATGRWTQPRPGVFAIAGTPATWEQRVMSACLHAGPSAAAARRTAARQRDRTRQNALVLAGWTVLGFTWRDFTRRRTDVVRAVAAALELGHSRR